jgi:TonB-dependent receptor
MPRFADSPRFRRTLRLAGSGLLALCWFFALAGREARAEDAGRRRFDIAAGPAVSTLKRAAQQAGLEIVYSAAVVSGVQTQPVAGEFTPREALEHMVAHTALRIFPDPATGALSVLREPDNEPNSPAPPSPPKEPPRSMKPKNLLTAFTGWLALALGPLPAVKGASDAPAGLGVVTGRIYNPATGEYLRNAEVRAVGGPSTASEDGGVYRLAGLVPGEVSLVVDFTGYRSAAATVRVTAGETVKRDFELTSSLQPVAADGTVKLSAFVVSSQREGNAKAIMEQRNSMNITNSVSSDVFGDVAEGNVGEFLKHLPGVDYDATDGTVRYVSLRGLGSEYAGVTVDGMSFPSADANASAGRAFSFEQVSLSAMESIEVSKTISADVDASSPAGTINLKTKRAFDRAGRRISASASVTGQSDQFTLRRNYGPGDDRSLKLFPSGQLEYSDIFLNKRLGIVLGVSESNSYLQRAPTTLTYNYTPTAASPDPVALTAIRVQQIHQTIERFATSFTADFKATPNLVLSLSVMYNHSDVWSGQRAATFNTGARTTQVAGANVLTDFTTTANGSFTIEPQGVAKVGNGKSYAPRFEFNHGDLTVEGRASISDSVSSYDPMGYRDSVFSPGVLTLSNVRFKATRSSLNDGDWKIVQTTGGDWNDGALFTSPAITVNDGRYARDGLYTGEGTVTYRTRFLLPIVWKGGAKWKREVRDFQNRRSASFYTYTGPGAGTGAFRNFRSNLNLDFSEQDLYIKSISGGGVFLPDIMKVADTFRTHPEYFTATMTGTDFYNAYIASAKHYEEDITSLFLMGTTRIGKLNLRAGLRREATETDSLEFDARSSREVTAAGYAISAGRATTIPGVQYQFLSKPRLHRVGDYDHLFPSASLKYNFTRNLDLQVGFSKTVKRPQFGDVAGVWVINDDTLTITAPNVNLKPETSSNYSVRLARYFEPVGQVAINFFQNDIKDLHLANTRVSGAQFNPGDPTYDGYTFVTTVQSPNNVRVRGMELEYSQSLSFLPQPLNGLGVRASYTRNYAQVIVTNMSPNLVSAGLSYALGRMNAYANMNWGDSRPTVANGTQYLRHRLNLDVGGSYRITSRVSAFFSVRNVLNAPYNIMEQVGTNPAASRFFQKFGVTPTLGVKSTF